MMLFWIVPQVIHGDCGQNAALENDVETVPLVTGISPRISLKRVDLPHPTGPTTTVVLPRLISRFMLVSMEDSAEYPAVASLMTMAAFVSPSADTDPRGTAFGSPKPNEVSEEESLSRFFLVSGVSLGSSLSSDARCSCMRLNELIIV